MSRRPKGGTGKGSAGKAGGKAAGNNVSRASGAGRPLSVRVKTARGRKTSSTRWLRRQLNDPYVAEAKRRGYRSRAAFKLAEIDDKLGLLKPGMKIVDLGAAPGGWCQVAAERIGPKGRVIGLDLRAVDPLPGVTLLQGDFLDEDVLAELYRALGDEEAGSDEGAGSGIDAILSDMAAPATGHTQTDHLRIMGLAEAALDLAQSVLAPGGAFLAKVLQGGSERGLLDALKRDFAKVRHIKPPASRADSAELYVAALGFRGSNSSEDG